MIRYPDDTTLPAWAELHAGETHAFWYLKYRMYGAEVLPCGLVFSAEYRMRAVVDALNAEPLLLSAQEE
jgi:hypothetical protein